MDLADLVQRVDLGAVLLGARDVRDVDRVLRHPRAADVAAAEVVAALLEDAAERVVAVGAEVHGDRQRVRLVSGAARHRLEGGDLRQRRGRARRRLRVERRLGAGVVRVELPRVDRRRPGGVVEDLVGGAQLDVGVDERAAAHARAGDDGDVAHDPHVEHPARVVARMKQRMRELGEPVGVVAGGEAPAALEHADAPAPLGEPAGGDAASEAGADDDRVVGSLHRATVPRCGDAMRGLRHAVARGPVDPLSA